MIGIAKETFLSNFLCFINKIIWNCSIFPHIFVDTIINNPFLSTFRRSLYWLNDFHFVDSITDVSTERFFAIKVNV